MSNVLSAKFFALSFLLLLRSHSNHLNLENTYPSKIVIICCFFCKSEFILLFSKFYLGANLAWYGSLFFLAKPSKSYLQDLYMKRVKNQEKVLFLYCVKGFTVSVLIFVELMCNKIKYENKNKNKKLSCFSLNIALNKMHYVINQAS